MMSDMSPRPTWQMNTKYPKSASDSNMRRPMYPHSRPGNSPLHYTHRTPPQQQPPPRYNVPPQRYSSPHSQQLHPSHSAVTRNWPQSYDIRKANDGTHPRMSGPMRATAPLTYHGVPIHLSQPGLQPNHQRTLGHQEPHYGNINLRRGQIYQKQQLEMGSQPGGLYNNVSSRRPRPASDGSVCRNDVDMRGANSESDIHSQQTMRGRPVQHSHSAQFVRRENVPSGTYMASSSTTSLPQYAQLMTQPPPRSGSHTSMQEVASSQPPQRGAEARSAYTAGMSPQLRYKKPDRLVIQQSNDVTHSSPYEDVLVQPNRATFEDSRTPTSPLGRQPSYLTAMNTPLRQQREYFYSTHVLQ